MNHEHILHVTLTIRGPVLTKNSGPADFGVDAAVARVQFGAEDERNRPCLPGTLMKGKLREALEQLTPHASSHFPASFLAEWLPANRDPAPGEPGDDPYRGRLHFSDFVAAEAGSCGVRHRIAIDAETGSVQPHALQVIETPFAPGQEARFKGRIAFFADEPLAQQVERTVRFGLCWLTQVGADRTVGFGRLLRVEVTRDPGRPATDAIRGRETIPAPTALRLRIRPGGPLCIARHKIGDNLFESEEFIPGNVIAGAVVETWAALLGRRVGPDGVRPFAIHDPARSLLANTFDRLRFRHAFPAPADGQRPRIVPLSVAAAGKRFYDVASQPKPVLLKDETGRWVTPAFRIDWKGPEETAIESEFGHVYPARELRVRTAIDLLKRTADRGEDTGGGKLFAWEMVHPWTVDCTPVAWFGQVDFPDDLAGADRQALADQLSSLLSVLSFVSKTKARCSVDVTADGNNGAESDPGRSADPAKTVALVLETPALLCDPRFQNCPRPEGSLGDGELHALYAEAWHDISGGELALEHHFASQSLAGGGYLHHRFRRNQPYNPWLLTDAGSVFVFELRDVAAGRKKIANWLAHGLDLPRWAREAWGESWSANPYTPRNGFGEISIHEPHACSPIPNREAGEVLPIVMPEDGDDVTLPRNSAEPA